MPLSVDKFMSKQVNLTILIDDEEVKLAYQPNKFTPELAATLLNIESTESEPLAMAAEVQRKLHQMFMEVVVAWDVVAKEGDIKPIPLTLKGLQSIPGLFMLEMRLLQFLREEGTRLGGVARKLNGHSPGTSIAEGKLTSS
jgi:hypothetical protein